MSWQWIKALRLAEVLLMSGFLIIGSFFAIDRWDASVLLRLAAVCCISFFTILSIYAYNSAAGKSVDQYNLRLTSLQKYSARIYILLGSLFLALALGFSCFIGWPFILLNLLVFFIWVLYSHPRFGLKHRPYWGTVLHFVAQLVHFNMFYYAFKPVDSTSLSLSVYFAIAFAAGHLNHEVIDHDADLHAGVRNTATRQGIRFVSVLLVILCLFNLLYACGLRLTGVADDVAAALLLLPVVVHLLLYLVHFSRLKEVALRIRGLYRLVYFLSFLLLVLYRIYQSAG